MQTQLNIKLTDLLAEIKTEQVIGNTELTITDVVVDSRQAHEGALFVAVKGVNVDAHQFIPQVVQQGAAVVVCENLPSDLSPNTTYIRVADSTDALAHLASARYGHPSRKLKLVGVTGTNGKTTIATLLYEMARLCGHRAGLLSTVRNIVGDKSYDAVQTTPDHLSLNRLLAEMVEAGCTHAFMEVSSHACVQKRINGLNFAGGIFTNLTRDHLDFHGTMENYIRAKKSFFDRLPADAFALVNADDKQGNIMIQNTAAHRYTYSLRAMADYRARIVEETIEGTHIELANRPVEVMFTGRYNVYNLLAVYGASLLLGWEREQVLVNLSKLVPVDGRFQTLRSPRGFTAVVDYAHTPDALDNVLSTIADVLHGQGRIITVCGCGGDRDRGKRPIMARQAALGSDIVILTSDNPRSEDPNAILEDMRQGLTPDLTAQVLSIVDRKEAIRTACTLATKGDVVLVAGKGHENYQIIGSEKLHFDDREVLQNIFVEQQNSAS